MYRSTNDQRNRVVKKRYPVDNWVEVLTNAVKEVLYREPTLKDYTMFTIERVCRGSWTQRLYYNSVLIGCVKNIGGKYKFFKRDD